MVERGTKRPYIHFIGNSSTAVTGSCHHIRFQKYSILLDCGLIQDSDLVTNYRLNREQLKNIKVNQVDYVILSHNHIDHSGLIPALFARGCNAHVYVPKGSLELLRLLWQDSMKIMQSDCEKMKSTHGIKAAPFYTQDDIDKTLMRCFEVELGEKRQLTENMAFTYHSAGHIVYANQVLLELKEGSIIKRIGYTGDIGGITPRYYIVPRENLPFCDVLIGENTYNEPGRKNNAKDRAKDLEKIAVAVENGNKVLIPCFSLGRTQELLTELYHLKLMGQIPKDFPIYLDSPLAQRICNIWEDDGEWAFVKDSYTPIKDWVESVRLQNSNESCVILSASGFLNGGRVVSHLKTILPKSSNYILFVGYAGENNLASQIKSAQKEVVVDGVSVKNKAKIIELRSFSSHASYEELMDYYTTIRFNKIALVHGNQDHKVDFAHALQDKLHDQGNAARVVAVNKDQKIYF